MNPILKKVTEDVEEYGWHCLSVAPRTGEEGASFFSYTIGLSASYQHPELIVFGLESKSAHGVLSECVETLKSGTRLPVDRPAANILANGYDVIFKHVRKGCLKDYFAAAVRYYGHEDFGAYVLLWPDKQNQFQWESTEMAAQLAAREIIAGELGTDF